MKSEEKPEGNQEQGKKCCSMSGCGCGARVIVAIVLILIGWICGYLMGQGGFCGRKKWMCRDSMASGCPMTSTQSQQDSPSK